MDETLLLIPLEGAEWKGSRVAFGEDRAAVAQVFGPEERVNGSAYYLDRRLRCDFDAEDRLIFLECLGGDGLQPEIFGVKAFQAPADQVLALLEEKNTGAVDDSEAEYCYAFHGISVGVYRESTPQDVEAMVASMRAVQADVTVLVSGQVAETIAAEREQAAHWSAIGIGCANYYER